MTATGVGCRSCGTRLSASAKFCSECGVSTSAQPQQLSKGTVLSDMVHSAIYL
jgi:uncharacterized OB-fold protein